MRGLIQYGKHFSHRVVGGFVKAYVLLLKHISVCHAPRACIRIVWIKIYFYSECMVVRFLRATLWLALYKKAFFTLTSWKGSTPHHEHLHQSSLTAINCICISRSVERSYPQVQGSRGEAHARRRCRHSGKSSWQGGTWTTQNRRHEKNQLPAGGADGETRC